MSTNRPVSRRDFLKLVGALPLGWAAAKTLPFGNARNNIQSGHPNVLIVLFDALSAYDMSSYGFDRATTPNINRLAQRAIRYHNHFSGGNWTKPGTASLLTGVLPWTHRALNLNGRVSAPFVEKNIFTAFKDYYRVAYTHNGFANQLLFQFESVIDELIPRESLFLKTYDALVSSLFRNDEDIASISWIRDMKVNEEGSAYSLFLSHVFETLETRQIENLKPRFPRGIPATSQVNPYVLETAIDAVTNRLVEIPQPFLGYFHFMPPHHPYRTTVEFFEAFKDDRLKPVEKPPEILARKIISQPSLERMRTEYDEFILYADSEFGRLFNALETSGVLDNTWLILTSDHGEMFERGIFGHGSKVLYEPVIRIPLLIFKPGRTAGLDVYEPTSAVDVLPTLAHVTGQESPTWSEGRVLPPFAPDSPDRGVFAVQAIDSDPNAPLTQGSVSLVRENYKLHYYFGYDENNREDIVKLFDIESDPEELTDLAQTKKGTVDELLDEVKTKLAEANKPYLQ